MGALAAGDMAALQQAVADDPSILARETPLGVGLVMAACYHRFMAGAEWLAMEQRTIGWSEEIALGRVSAVSARASQGTLPLAGHTADGWTPLHVAAFFDRAEIVHLLLDAGADITVLSTNEQANQPLHAAAAGRALRSATALVERGAPVNGRTAQGYTPLMIAAANGLDKVAELLLGAGADPLLKDDEENDAFAHARRHGHEAVLRTLGRHRPS